MAELDRIKIDKFVGNILAKDFMFINSEWNSFSEAEKQEIRIILRIPENRQELKKLLSLVNEYIANDIFPTEQNQQKNFSNKITIMINGKNYTLKEMRDNCLQDIQFVQDTLFALKKLNPEKQKAIISHLKEIDPIFAEVYEKVLFPVENKTNKNYLTTKAELLGQYHSRLKQEGLTDMAIEELLLVEAKYLTFDTMVYLGVI